MKAGTGGSLALRNLQRRVAVDGGALRSFLRRAAAEVAPAGTLAMVVLVGDRLIRDLNRVYRGKDRPTDVLAFPADGTEGAAAAEGSYLGDIVISVETARRQALGRGSSLLRELRLLALHGLLHLVGYDHETDHGQMRRLEYRLRRKLGLTRRPGNRR